jgi:dihydrofolate reductase
MRRIIEYTLVSADGVFEDPQNWGLRDFQDDAYIRDGLGQLLACDAMLMGRRTYEILAKVYPSRTDPWAVRLNAMRQYVFSSTLEDASWDYSTIVRGDVAAEVANLKQHEGRDLLIWGHGLLAGTRVAVAWSLEMRSLPLRFAARVAYPLMRWGHDQVVEMAVAGFRLRAMPTAAVSPRSDRHPRTGTRQTAPAAPGIPASRAPAPTGPIRDQRRSE